MKLDVTKFRFSKTPDWLREVEELHKKNINLSNDVSEKIEARAEEILRCVKKFKNELLDECYLITNQNNANVSSFEQYVSSNMSSKDEKDLSTIFQDFISRKVDAVTNENGDETRYTSIASPHLELSMSWL